MTIDFKENSIWRREFVKPKIRENFHKNSQILINLDYVNICDVLSFKTKILNDMPNTIAI